MDGSSIDSFQTENSNKINSKITPVQALEELERVPKNWDLFNIDEKIEMLKKKSQLIVQHYTKREIFGLIERLENRKKYTSEKAFFERFDNTTDEKIEALLQKYRNLKMNTSDIFVPEFPDEAINIMSEYTEKCMNLFGKKPIFYIIADEKDFVKSVNQRDPILLVQSPFGFYWQILGAWDKEMLLLSEL